MNGHAPVSRRATAFTSALQGASLDELLEAAEEDRWPNHQCEREWVLLRTWAIQAETLQVDEAENLAWEQRMRELSSQELEYTEWVARRLEALSERVRERKLQQTRLRYAYGFKPGRRRALIIREVRRFYRQWAGTNDDHS